MRQRASPPQIIAVGMIPTVGLPAFVGSGTGHARGLVPDPGAVDGETKFLREDASWAVPAGGGGSPDWGDIGGDLAGQADLAGALAGKSATGHSHAEYDPTGTAASAVAAHAAASDPHAGYQRESEKDAANGYPGVDANTRLVLARLPLAGSDGLFLVRRSGASAYDTIADGDIPSTIARDSEVSAAVTAHEAAADPHTGYQKESEKGSASGYAGLDGSSKLTGSQQVYGTGTNTACQGNDARLSDARTPTAHATSHQPGGGDAMAVDASAATGSLRTLGTGAAQACGGTDSRLSDSRAPNGSATGDLAGSYPAPTVTQARGLRETGGPTTLAMGAVADGEYLRRSGSSIVGGSPAGGSGGAAEVSITLTDDQPVTLTVTGLSWVTSSSKLVASPFATTADGLTVEQYVVAGLVWVVSNRVNGVGFDLTARSLAGAPGTYRFHVIGA